MRVLIAQVNHETNTFSPMKTPLAAFRPVYGSEALKATKGKQTPVGAFRDWADARGAEVICPILAHAWPSGPVEDEAFEHICDTILSALDDTIDLVLLDLHGAMVTRSHEDGEGELLSRLRARRPDVPICVALDLHAHVTEKMVATAQAICGYLTYPHVDMYETGQRLTAMIDFILNGEQPQMRHVALPLIAHTLPMNTSRPGVMRDIMDLLSLEATTEGIHDLSLFGGFPASDIREAGMSLVGMAQPGTNLDAVLERLADQIWNRRQEFIYNQLPLEQSLALAKSALEGAGEGPVLLLDHGDNCMSGGTCDNIDVLSAALQSGMTGILAGPINDPLAVALAYDAGEGAELSLEIGNKIPAENFAPPLPPLRINARVTKLGSGTYQVTGPIYTGMICEMGRVALLETCNARILISETAHEPWDRGIFTSLGIDPNKEMVLLLKSRMYCRPVFEPISKAVVEIAGGGVTGSDFRLFEFQKLRRPIYPIDNGAAWKMNDDAAD